MMMRDGVPQRVPTLTEARLLADARRTVADLLGVEVLYTEAAEVREHYGLLIREQGHRISAAGPGFGHQALPGFEFENLPEADP